MKAGDQTLQMYGQFEGLPLIIVHEVWLGVSTDPCKINILNLKIIQLKMKTIFQTSIFFWVHVSASHFPPVSRNRSKRRSRSRGGKRGSKRMSTVDRWRVNADGMGCKLYMPADMSNDQNHVYLLYIGNYTTQLYIIVGIMICQYKDYRLPICFACLQIVLVISIFFYLGSLK